MKATCYHFRDMKGPKIVGGSLGMSRPLTLDEGAAQVVAMLDVSVTTSGRVRFTHKGSEVYAYLSLDPSETEKGKAAKRAWLAAREAENREASEACPRCGWAD